MPDLPLLLIGPILRRVEPHAVAVFVATSKAASVRVAVYDGQVDVASLPPELGSFETQTTRFAAAFHAAVCLVSFADAASLQPGHLYSYDVRITPPGEAAQSLKDLKLLGDPTLAAGDTPQEIQEEGTKSLLEDVKLKGYGKKQPASADVEVVALGYAEHRLPSFVTCPAALDELVLAHASCRMAHGVGHPALQNLDAYIDDLDGAAEGRPHMLFLTGDQIYADDVSSALLPGVNALAIQLLGDVEQVPSPRGGAPMLVNMTVLPAGFRQRITGSAGFTSDWASSHLIGYGEYLAMYCVAWNPALWPLLAVADSSDPDLSEALKTRLAQDATDSESTHPDAPALPVVLRRPSPDAPDDVITPLYGGTQPAADALKRVREEFLASKAQLDEYRREVAKVRRLLANVPTYMICDDHDVTDDWFMTGGIRGRNLGNPFGKALVRNALAAHTVCQAWGNEPVTWFHDADHQALLNGIAAMFPESWSGGPPQSAGSNEVDRVLGLTSAEAEPVIDFSFGVDGPMHHVRVLDTRMRRQYDTAGASPGLLTQAALDHQLPQSDLDDLPDAHVLVVVSPAPVYGPPLLSEIGGAILMSKHDVFNIARSETERALQEDVTGLPYGTPVGKQFYDIEYWGAHPAAFERLLERLSHHPRVVVFGGDVHYGAAFAMDWTGAGRTSRIVHFTSSAARNEWKESASKLGAPGIVHNLIALNGLATGLQHIGLPLTRLGWSATLPPVVEGLDQEPPATRIRVHTGPVLLSDEMFRAVHPLQRPPEWVWRAGPIVDERAPDDRPPAARLAEPAADLPADGGAVRQYGDLAAMHVQALRTAAVARGLQFLNNVGVVTFATENGTVHVRQALLSLRSRQDPNERAADYIVHATTLEPDPVPVPASVGPGA